MVLSVLLVGVMAAGPDTVLERHRSGHGFSIEFTSRDSVAALAVAGAVGRGIRVIERYFQAPFKRTFVVRIYPDRAALTAHWAAAWQVPDLKTECWMVASGAGDELAVLSPAAWATDACEHDSADRASTDRLIWHEIVHVYHGQRNPRPSFDGMDEMGWFVEGVAVLASGQLRTEHRGKASEAIAAGKAPAALAAAWSGAWRYGVSGSLVGYVDRTRGRHAIIAMLADTTNAGLLVRVGLPEAELLKRWRASP